MKPQRNKPLLSKAAVTLLELLVVVLIIGILSTVATGVYVGQVERARIAATKDLINQLSIAITRYEVDLGELPPSGSGPFPATPINTGNTGGRRDGSGYLQLALVHSMSASALNPASSNWHGSYISLQSEQLDDENDENEPGSFDILDPFGNPIIYVRAEDYQVRSTDFNGGTFLFSTPIAGQNPDLPAPNPYLAQGETFYNPTTYQLISFGPNGATLSVALPGLGSRVYQGAEADDITNFGH